MPASERWPTPTPSASEDPNEDDARPEMRVIALSSTDNPYSAALYGAMRRKRGVAVVDGVLAGRWLWRSLRRGDWLHIQYPSFSYAAGNGSAPLLFWFTRWLVLLALTRAMGARIVWTAHNLLPHEPSAIPALDWLGRRVVIAYADRVMVHGENAAAMLVSTFPSVAAKTALMCHGHWIDYYPHTLSRGEARARLGVTSGAFVYLFIGSCKRYKNVDGLVKAFRGLPGTAVLLIAGHFSDPTYLDEVSRLAEGDARIRICAEYLPDDQIQEYLLACDVVVAPYREILTSGTAMLAMSFGRPIVSVAMGFLKDVVTPKTGLLFAPSDPEGLAEALTSVRDREFSEVEILSHARQYSFDVAAEQLIAALRHA